MLFYLCAHLSAFVKLGSRTNLSAHTVFILDSSCIQTMILFRLSTPIQSQTPRHNSEDCRGWGWGGITIIQMVRKLSLVVSVTLYTLHENPAIENLRAHFMKVVLNV